jgi:hypothetical protein
MEERINQVITKRNTDDKHISIYDLCIALLAITSFINFLLTTFVPLPASIKQILTEFDYGVALIFLVDFLFRLLRAPKKLEYMRTWGWVDMLSAVPIPFFSIFRIVRAIRVAITLRKMRLLRTSFLYFVCLIYFPGTLSSDSPPSEEDITCSKSAFGSTVRSLITERTPSKLRAISSAAAFC